MKVKEQQLGYLKLPPIVEEMGDHVIPVSPQRPRDDATGHLVCWGCGEFGQHGHGYKKEIPFLDGRVDLFCGNLEHLVKHIGCGSSHTAVVTATDELYLWGNGNSGQLGGGDLATRLEPHKISVYSNQSQIPGIAGVACGGRHTMVWLDNGHVFTFGNNFNAQLGYDFRERNFKENQTQPTLLKILLHKPVAQVACGDKHSVFRFKDGGTACVGNNANGQIGNGCREDAVMPRALTRELNQPIKMVAAGSQHTLAVTDTGVVYVWGYGKACGSKADDVLEPRKMATHRNNIVAVAGGSSHSMALSNNGSVYTWGSGSDGQLGHGEKVRFLSHPKRLKDRHVISKCIQISCGETFSSAVTEKGLLYMWGKNSHTIMPDKPTTHKIFLPYGVNKNFRGGRIARVFCGSWHAVAQNGRPEVLERDENDDSGESNEELMHCFENGEHELELDIDDSESDEEMDTGRLESRREISRLESRRETSRVESRRETSRLESRRESSRLEREKTTVSLADFYAPTPDPKTLRSPSPEFFYPNPDEEDIDRINSTRSAATLIVQLPLQPMTSYADAATSPMTLTTTSSSNKGSSVTTLSRVPSPVAELPYHKIERLHKKLSRPEKKFKEFDPQKYEREKLRNTKSPMSEVVQLSKSSADSFILPREPTGLSKKHVDFSEMEEIRLKGPKSPEKISRTSRRRDSRESSPNKLRDLSPAKIKEHLRDLNNSRSRHRYLDSSLSFKSDSALMESPLFRGSKSSAMHEMLARKPWDAPVTQLEERQYKHHVPKHSPRKYNKNNNPLSESNFGLQISRSKTIIAPLPGDGYEPSDRLAQLRRYAAIHNPPTTGKPTTEKLRPIKNRQVSIPGGRAESPGEDKDQLFIGGQFGSKDKPAFSSGSTWKDRSDFDRLAAARKLPAAGIVKMYIANSELVGTVENPLYTTLSDGRGHADPLLDSDSLMIQPLLKKKLKQPDRSHGIELPAIAINRHGSNSTANVLTARTVPESRHFESEEFDAVLVGNSTSRGIGNDHVVGSRVS